MRRQEATFIFVTHLEKTKSVYQLEISSFISLVFIQTFKSIYTSWVSGSFLDLKKENMNKDELCTDCKYFIL